MDSSKRRHDGGAYRRYTTMMAAHAKPGKDRGKARRKQPKRKKAGNCCPRPSCFAVVIFVCAGYRVTLNVCVSLPVFTFTIVRPVL